MNILDNLFSAAAKLSDQAQSTQRTVLLGIAITVTPRSSFPSNQDLDSISLGWGQLSYSPAKVAKLGQYGYINTPAYFENRVNVSANTPQGSTSRAIGISITGSKILHIESANYSVAITFQDANTVAFIPQVHPATNVIYGTEGTNFITISLGDLRYGVGNGI